MVSLKKYTKEQILNEIGESGRFSKIASLLDPSDFEDQMQQTLSWLDMTIFYPRAKIFEAKDMIGYKGGTFVDVTPYNIDVINNVYYQDTFDEMLNTILPEVGLMPFILGGSTFTSLSSIGEYISLRTNLNEMTRLMELNGDYELWPKDNEGRQLLQVKKPGMLRVEFLPSIDRNATEWYLYDFEYAAFKDILYDKCNLFNAEQQMSAQTLGVAKDAKVLVDYWTNKLEKDEKAFTDKSLVTYIC